MAKGKAGADSSVIVTTQIGGQSLIALATTHFGQTPVFWGRYFSSATSTGWAEYRHLKENAALRSNNIRLLPIAQQTKNVNGTQAAGSADAEANADDFIATFGADYLASLDQTFYMFLDVEGSPSLSQAYYTGWAQTLPSHSSSATGGRVTILPCLYATQGDTPTWNAAAAACAGGAQCMGAWVARWPSSGCQPLPDWSDAMTKLPVKIPVLIWQYADDCNGGGGFDCSETNPEIDLQNDLLNHLVLPPDVSALVS